MPKQKKIIDKNQQKITSMLTPTRKNNEKLTQANIVNKESLIEHDEENADTTENSASEDEDDWPLTFSQFDAYTNIADVVREFLKKKKPDHYEKIMKSTKPKYVDYVKKTKRSYYKMFYTRPDLRADKRLNLLRIKPNAPASIKKRLFDVPKKYQYRLKKKEHNNVQPIVSLDAANQSNMSVNTAVWENDIRDPQPSTSKRATQFMLKSCTPEARKRIALSLLNERRAYNAEAESDLPVSFEKFKQYTKSDDVIDNIIDVATDGDTRMFEKLKSDLTIRERVLRNYYHAYYDSPDVIRLHYPICFKACPLQVKNDIQQMSGSPASKRVEIISIEDIHNKTNEESTCTRDSVGTGITVVAKIPNTNEAKEEEEDMPISFADFEAHTNLMEATLAYIKRKYANEWKKIMQKKSFVEKTKNFIYKMFYTRPDLRTDKTLRLLKLNERAPIKVRNKFYDIPKAYQHKEKRPKRKLNEKYEEVINEIASTCTPLTDVRSHYELNKILNVEQQTLALWLVNTTHTYSLEDEQKIPISMEKFSKFTRIDEIVDEIIEDASEGNTEKLQCLKADESVRKRVLYNYFFGFYLSPAIVRLHYPIRFKACPSFMKMQIEKIPNIFEENNNNMQVAEEKLVEKHVEMEKVHEEPATEVAEEPLPVAFLEPAKVQQETTSCVMQVTREKLHAANMELTRLKNIAEGHMEAAFIAQSIAAAEKEINEILQETPNITDRLEMNTQPIVNNDIVMERAAASPPILNDSYQINAKYTRFISDEEINRDMDELMRTLDRDDPNHLESSKRAATGSPIGFRAKRSKLQNLSCTDATDPYDMAEDVSSLDLSEELIVNIGNSVEFPLKRYSGVVAHTFSKPVNDLEKIEENLPISCEHFKANIDTAAVLDLLCKTIANGNQRWFRKMREDENMCKTMLSNFYIQFFINHYMKLFFPVKETENEQIGSFRKEFEETQNVKALESATEENESQSEKQATEENESQSEKQATEELLNDDSQKLIIDSSTEAVNESTQTDKLTENENEKLQDNETENESEKLQDNCKIGTEKVTETESEELLIKDGTETSSEENNNEKVASIATRQFFALYSTQYSRDFLSQYIKSKVLPEFESEVLCKLENFLHIENAPLNPKENAEKAKSRQIVKKDGVKSRSPTEVYFDKWQKRHSLEYMFLNSVGEKHKIWSAILSMTFQEYKQYTHITLGNDLYKDAELIARCYCYTILERNTWPSNLFFSLENLINYLKHKNELHLDNFTLEHISPKLISYKDLFHHTNFYACTAEYFNKRVEDFDSKALQEKAKDFYIQCWLTNSWKTRVPVITDEALKAKLSDTPSSTHEKQSQHSSQQAQPATQNNNTITKETQQKQTETNSLIKLSTPQRNAVEKTANTKSSVSNVAKTATEEQVKSPATADKANVGANSGKSGENASSVGASCSTQNQATSGNNRKSFPINSSSSSTKQVQNPATAENVGNVGANSGNSEENPTSVGASCSTQKQGMNGNKRNPVLIHSSIKEVQNPTTSNKSPTLLNSGNSGENSSSVGASCSTQKQVTSGNNRKSLPINSSSSTTKDVQNPATFSGENSCSMGASCSTQTQGISGNKRKSILINSATKQIPAKSVRILNPCNSGENPRSVSEQKQAKSKKNRKSIPINSTTKQFQSLALKDKPITVLNSGSSGENTSFEGASCSTQTQAMSRNNRKSLPINSSSSSTNHVQSPSPANKPIKVLNSGSSEENPSFESASCSTQTQAMSRNNRKSLPNNTATKQVQSPSPANNSITVLSSGSSGENPSSVGASCSTQKQATTLNNRRPILINAATKEKVKSPVKVNQSIPIPNSGSSEENPSFVGVTCSTQKQVITPSPNLFSSSSGSCSAPPSDNAVPIMVEIAAGSQPSSQPPNNNSQVLAEHSYYFENSPSLDPNTSNPSTTAGNVADDPLSTQALLNMLLDVTTENNNEPAMKQPDEIKTEKRLPDKMRFTLSDSGTLINVEPIQDEIINIDEDDCNIENLLAMSESPRDVISNITLPSSEEYCSIRQTQPLLEQSQAHPVPNNLASSNVTIRKRHNRNTAPPKTNANANSDFGPQLTHVFRALPVQPVVRRNAFLTAAVKLHTQPNQSATYSMSQDLSLFNSSQVLRAVLQGTDGPTTSTAAAAGAGVGAAKKPTTSNIPVRNRVIVQNKNNTNSKQVNNNQPIAAEAAKKELLLYHKIKKFDYFAALTHDQVVDFELPVTPCGQSYMRALICTGDTKFWLQGDNLESVFSYFRQDIITSIRNLLKEVGEFHYDEYEHENAAVKGICDEVQKICHEALYHIFNTAIPISACQLQLSNSLGGYNRGLVRIKRFSGVPAAKLDIQKIFSTEFKETVKKRLDQTVIIIN